MTAENQLQHVNVCVSDLARATAFYRDVLGLPLDATPDQGFESQFFRIGSRAQVHMNVIEDAHAFRAHFCIEMVDFMGVFHRSKAAGAIDVRPWGRVRQLPSGKMQMFVRDPDGNLVEVASTRDAVIDPALFSDPLVEPRPGTYRIPRGMADGRHEDA